MILNLSHASSVEPSGITFHSSNVTVDGSWPGDAHGRHLTITTPDFTDKSVWFSDNASHNTIRCCVIQNLTVNQYGSSNNFYAIEFGSTFGSRQRPIVGNRVENCETIGGSWGLINSTSAQSIDSTIIQYCDIHDFDRYGAEFNNGNGICFAHNRIFNVNPSRGGFCGIYMYYGGSGIFGSVF